MAIYHHSVKAVSRSSGRSSTAAAAYRAAEKIVDSRTGEIHDFGRKRGVEESEIVMPKDSTWEPTRSELWNAAELAEKRKDACVAREHEIALPKELTAEQRKELVHAYAQDLADRHGCAVDYSIHAPHKGRDGKENDNYHAHLLCTTREVEGEGLGAKCLREQAGQKRSADLELERSTWADHINAALEKAGHSVRVDHRTLEEQGIEREPQQHKGAAVTAIERKHGSSIVGERMQAEQREVLTKDERDDMRRLDSYIEGAERSLAAAVQEKEKAIQPKPAERAVEPPKPPEPTLASPEPQQEPVEPPALSKQAEREQIEAELHERSGDRTHIRIPGQSINGCVSRGHVEVREHYAIQSIGKQTYVLYDRDKVDIEKDGYYAMQIRDQGRATAKEERAPKGQELGRGF